MFSSIYFTFLVTPVEMGNQKESSHLNFHLLVPTLIYAACPYHTKMKTLVKCNQMWKLYQTYHHAVHLLEVPLGEWHVFASSMRHVF